MKRIIAMVLIALSLSACASGRYQSTKVQDSIFRVSYSGNSHVSESSASDNALLRSAEITLQNGYKYFVVLDQNTKSDTYVTAGGGSSYTYGSVDKYGNINAQTTDVGGGVDTYHKSTSTMMIQCFHEKPKTRSLVYDAGQIQSNVKEHDGLIHKTFLKMFHRSN